MKFLMLLLTLSPMAFAKKPAPTTWEGYLKTIPAKEKIQAQCYPRILKAKSEVPHRGTVLAIHGFTACPQQFLEIAEHWNEAGFDVILPLLPGHGKIWEGNKDDFGQLPDKRNIISLMENFATSMNSIMSKTQGEKVIVGLSVGGTVSLLSTQLAPQLYDRSLIIAPFLKVSAVGKPGSSFFMGLSPLLGEIKIGWGKGCEETERSKGRHGICNFKLKHIAALQKLGRRVRNHVEDVSVPMQLVGVENDSAIDNRSFKSFYQKLSDHNQQSSLCFYPTPANHSLLSRFDAPDEDKFWLDSALKDLTAFVVSNSWIPSLKESESEGVPLCR